MRNFTKLKKDFQIFADFESRPSKESFQKLVNEMTADQFEQLYDQIVVVEEKMRDTGIDWNYVTAHYIAGSLSFTSFAWGKRDKKIKFQLEVKVS